MKTLSSPSRCIVAVAALVALALAAGCGKREEKASETGAQGQEQQVVPIPAEEAERGRQACEHYADQVCECALKEAELSGECELARTRPGALDLNLRAAAAKGNANQRDRMSIQSNARSIARACIEDTAALVKRGCAITAQPETRVAPASSPKR